MERSSELVCTGVALYSRTRLLELRVRRGKTQVLTLQRPFGSRSRAPRLQQQGTNTNTIAVHTLHT
jgi:hypothetical protein